MNDQPMQPGQGYPGWQTNPHSAMQPQGYTQPQQPAYTAVPEQQYYSAPAQDPQNYYDPAQGQPYYGTAPEQQTGYDQQSVYDQQPQ